MKNYEITAGAALAAMSAALQLVHLGWLSPWGMWIDLVAIPWVVAYFLYGARLAFSVSLIGTIIITLFDPSTWLGAGMKLVATLPMILIPIIMQKVLKLRLKDFNKLQLVAAAVVIAIILRGAIVTPINYYLAIPIWTGWTTTEAMTFIPWWAIVGINAVQGILEVLVAWLLVFKGRLSRFATWRYE